MANPIVRGSKGRPRKMPKKGKRTKRGFNRTGNAAYRPEWDATAKQLAKQGFSDADIAGVLEVSPGTFAKTKAAVPSLARALVRGEQAMTVAIEKSMFARATGYSHPSEKIFIHKGRVVRARTEEFLPPDVKAGELLLKAYAPDRFGDKLELRGDQSRPVKFVIEGLEDNPRSAKEVKKNGTERKPAAAD